MKKIVTLVLLALSIQSFAQYDPEAKVVLDAMSDRYKTMPAFTASFTQKLTNETAGLEESIDGVVTVMKSMYKLDIAGQEVYNDGKDIWNYNKDIKEVTVSEFVSDEQDISLNNVWDLYKDGFKYILLSENPNGSRVVDLDPVDRSKSFYKVRMIIDKKNELLSFTVFENNGNQYRYQILSLSERTDLDASFFAFDPSKYPDVEVIDFR